MHVAEFEAYVVLFAEYVHAECSLIREIHSVGACGNVVVGEDSSAAEFEVWRETSVAFEVPFEAERIKAYAIGGVCRLKYKEDRNCVDRILKSSPKKARKMRLGKNPSIAQSGVEGGSVTASAADGMAATRPDLHLVPAFLRAGLGYGKYGRDCEKK